jgi:ribonuclease J
VSLENNKVNSKNRKYRNNLRSNYNKNRNNQQNVKGEKNYFNSSSRRSSSQINTKYKNAYKLQLDKMPSVKVSFLGGLNEIGKNITLFECEDEIIVIDCGMAFPDGEMFGVDLVIPDFTYLVQNKDKVKGILLTHGHEDHIGGLPYLLSEMSVPIYGTPLTIGLVENKLREHSLLHQTELKTIHAGQTIRLGKTVAEFIHVNHSIPDAIGIALHTPGGTIVHTGDFKIDCTPISGGMIDLSRFARLGEEGVLALMSDSTNASRDGYTPTEHTVYDSFKNLFQKAEKERIIIATFASNVNRVQQIINCAKKFGRKVAFSGRSMINYMNVSRNLGYLDVPENTIIELDQISQYPPEQIVLVTTGSQGEPMSALSRMAFSDHRKITVGAGDFIIISANPIPGNEKSVGNVVDELLKKGCKVVYESMYEVHVSGHACAEELKILTSLVKPKYYIPVHGEQKHLRKSQDIALSLGIDKKNTFIADVGTTLEINRDYMKELQRVPAGKVFVDGLGVGDVGSIVLRDRKHLAQDGLIIIVASLDVYDGHVISGPDIVSRGFVYVRESEDLMKDVKQKALAVLEDCCENNIHEWGIIKNRIKDDVSKIIAGKTGRSPMILPILMEV